MRRTKNQAKKPLLLCPYCIEAIESRGERIKKFSFTDVDEDSEDYICGWCQEETEDLTECEFT